MDQYEQNFEMNKANEDIEKIEELLKANGIEDLDSLPDIDTSCISDEELFNNFEEADQDENLHRTDASANATYSQSSTNVDTLELFNSSSPEHAVNFNDDYVFTFEIKPSPHFSFAFPCDLGKANTYMKDANNVMPRVLFETSNTGHFYLHIDLFEKSATGRAEIQFSPHVLAQVDEDLTVAPKFKELKLLEKPGKRKSYVYELDKVYIVQSKNGKKTEKFNEKVTNDMHYPEKAYQPSNGHTGLLLGCQVFEKRDDDLFKPITERIYSDEMCPLVRISIPKKRFNHVGGEEIEVSIKSEVCIENLSLSISCKEHPKKHDGWQAPCEILLKKDKLLKFLTPRCDVAIFDSNIKEVNCELKLIKEQDHICSKPIRVIYELHANPRAKRCSDETFEETWEEANTSKMRKMSRILSDFSRSVSSNDQEHKMYVAPPMPTSTRVKASLLDRAIKCLQQSLKKCSIEDKKEKFLELNDAYADMKREDGNSIIHDAITENKYLTVHKIMQENNVFELMPQLRNNDDDTPLHYACKLGRKNVVQSLCKPFYTLYLQNSRCETPLHVAVAVGESCLTVLKTIFFEEDFTTKDYKTTFLWLLQVYDKNGLTFLHLAVLKKRFEFLESVLKYCQKENIDACQHVTLYTGDTILHLAQEAKTIDLILKYQPHAAYYTNYGNKTAVKCEPELHNLVVGFENVKL